MKNFKKLTVWNRGMELAREISRLLEKLPKEERYTYRDQIIRCSISIPSNIAEGASRDSQKDFKRFLQISLGSSYELETQLLLLEMNRIIAAEALTDAQLKNEEVQKMLHSLMKKLS